MYKIAFLIKRVAYKFINLENNKLYMQFLFYNILKKR